MTAPARQSSDLGALIQREQAAALYSTVRAGTYSDALVSLVFGLLMYWQMRRVVILAWIAAHLFTVLRMPYVTAGFPQAGADRDIPRWIDIYCRELGINAAGWGVAALLFLPDSLPLACVMTLVIMGMGMGGAFAVAPLRRATYTLLLPMMLGLTLALLLHPEPLRIFMAGCCVVFLVSLLRFAHAQRELLVKSLRTRFEKEILADQLAEQVRATEQASQEKTRFLAAASHDLRQPLHAIALLGAALETELAGRPERVGAARLMRAVGALSRSLDTMLDVSRLDAGVVVAERQPVAVHGLFQSLNHSFFGMASGKDIQLRFRATPLWVHSDPQLLRRLLSNLIDNAIKYTQQGGVLVVARRRFAREAERRGEEVWIEVYDSGIGIASDQQQRVFEEFYQVGNAGRDRSLGLGIGLSIVKRLSQLLAHPVELHSVSGRGTRLRLRLPPALPQPHATDLPPAPLHWRPPACPAGRVLVMDDEADVREAMCRLLQVHGLRGEAVANETEAMSALQAAVQAQSPFALLVCDYRLASGVDGLQVGQRLSRIFADLPLLLVTGETAPERLQRVRDAGVPVLFKPVAAEQLLQAVAAAARKNASPAQ